MSDLELDEEHLANILGIIENFWLLTYRPYEGKIPLKGLKLFFIFYFF